MEFLIGMIFGVAGVIVFGLTGAAIWLTSLLSTKKKYCSDCRQYILQVHDHRGDYGETARTHCSTRSSN